MNITVLGCGRWGSFHAWYSNHIGHTVTLWGRPESNHMKDLMKSPQK
jgi:glycerol-3-phosphate dehydrogenase (NAD(P)+)